MSSHAMLRIFIGPGPGWIKEPSFWNLNKPKTTWATLLISLLWTEVAVGRDATSNAWEEAWNGKLCWNKQKSNGSIRQSGLCCNRYMLILSHPGYVLPCAIQQSVHKWFYQARINLQAKLFWTTNCWETRCWTNQDLDDLTNGLHPSNEVLHFRGPREVVLRRDGRLFPQTKLVLKTKLFSEELKIEK